MFCDKCGSEIEEGSNFCRVCGNKVEKSIQSVETKENNSSKGEITSFVKCLLLSWGIALLMYILPGILNIIINLLGLQNLGIQYFLNSALIRIYIPILLILFGPIIIYLIKKQKKD